jgi:hypothetical protein
VAVLALCRAGAVAADPVPQPAAPPVGFVQVTVPSNGYALVSMPFEPFAPGVNAILGGQLTGSTGTNAADVLMRWLPAAQVYTNAWRAAGFGDPALDGLWIEWPAGTPTSSSLTLSAGDAFWLQSRQPFEQRAFVAGRVPLASSASTTLVPGLNLSGYPYATSIGVNQTALHASGGYGFNDGDGFAGGDTFLRWDDAMGGYAGYSLYAAMPQYNWPAGWYGGDPDNPTTDALRLGEGFWYQRDIATNSFVWTELRPYADAFGDASSLPRVVGLSVDPAVPSATLTVEAQSGTNHPVDILTLDAGTNGTFATTGWSHADRVQSLGRASFAWNDLAGCGRPAVTDVHARFYLAARADLDADIDGLPDALETHVYATNPALADTDDDGNPDGWELDGGFDPTDPASRSMFVYVDAAAGDNANDGYSAPVRDIAVGAARARAGDTVVVAAGTYEGEPASLAPCGGGIRIRPQGTVRIR